LRHVAQMVATSGRPSLRHKPCAGRLRLMQQPPRLLGRTAAAEIGRKQVHAQSCKQVLGLGPPAPDQARRRATGKKYGLSSLKTSRSSDDLHPGAFGRRFKPGEVQAFRRHSSRRQSGQGEKGLRPPQGVFPKPGLEVGMDRPQLGHGLRRVHALGADVQASTAAQAHGGEFFRGELGRLAVSPVQGLQQHGLGAGRQLFAPRGPEKRAHGKTASATNAGWFPGHPKKAPFPES
jgi:hypothetical protein